MRTSHLAVIPGDGIGPEVIAESVKTLQALSTVMDDLRFTTRKFEWGTEHSLRTGAMLLRCSGRVACVPQASQHPPLLGSMRLRGLDHGVEISNTPTNGQRLQRAAQYGRLRVSRPVHAPRHRQCGERPLRFALLQP